MELHWIPVGMHQLDISNHIPIIKAIWNIIGYFHWIYPIIIQLYFEKNFQMNFPMTALHWNLYGNIQRDISNWNVTGYIFVEIIFTIIHYYSIK
jgi:hypothetical protein